MALTYTVIVTYVPEDEAYIARVPLLEVETWGRTEEEAFSAAREAIELDLIGRVVDQNEIPVEPVHYATIGEVTIDDIDITQTIGIEGQEALIRQGLREAITAGGSGKRNVPNARKVPAAARR
jgi:predicted RNase H-like HicB family nuclease